MLCLLWRLAQLMAFPEKIAKSVGVTDGLHHLNLSSADECRGVPRPGLAFFLEKPEATSSTLSNLTIEDGERVATVGVWDSGRSTIACLFRRLHEPAFARPSSTLAAVRDLRKALGEDITSIDITVTTIDPGTNFDSAFMVNGWPTLTRENTLGTVSGTTGLGLKKVMAPGPFTAGVSLAPNADVIYRPKVILERTVTEALVPPSSRA
ncbi:uncharacterized protein LACBIDRAFT_327656 [Laccaria bicolor S238N-H82]|uniref:Predicted protein n=1 Tax=Laccaria bicolor (strain S238N-H82 / ATCC MYA-4686) TaxID=486041 RepID=B0DCF4_LACBS|nr:uncharacterized protein LACBIDRAFT_327656 [Laccaria bicolor S238N-H82]EDR07721.1 predicted protein [Laccaria bicolor S238N-H82]|eukprot:XP_001881510.1 predicted protein [Laccaria bicolor S238N-H82]